MDYKNGKIYKIVNDEDDEIYVGSTTQILSKRMHCHRSKAKMGLKSKIYDHMRKIGVECFQIILIEDYPCERKEQLWAREEYFRRQLNAKLNSHNCLTTLEERKKRMKDNHKKNYQINKEKTGPQLKKYREEHKEEMKKYQAVYRQTNKERRQTYQQSDKYKECLKLSNAKKYAKKRQIRIHCICGGEMNSFNVKVHERTKKHTKFMEDWEEIKKLNEWSTKIYENAMSEYKSLDCKWF